MPLHKESDLKWANSTAFFLVLSPRACSARLLRSLPPPQAAERSKNPGPDRMRTSVLVVQRANDRAWVEVLIPNVRPRTQVSQANDSIVTCIP